MNFFHRKPIVLYPNMIFQDNVHTGVIYQYVLLKILGFFNALKMFSYTLNSYTLNYTNVLTTEKKGGTFLRPIGISHGDLMNSMATVV